MSLHILWYPVSMVTDLEAYVFFSYMLGIGPMKFDLLVNYSGSVEKAYQAKPSIVKQILGESLSRKCINFRETFDFKKELRMIKENNIIILTQEDSRFPKSLLNIADPPICLYVKGDISQYNFDEDLFLAIVGTRKPTYYGELVTTKFASELAQAGLVIVSGLALGIDAIAHKAALDVKGRTIAFLGCGVNIAYPPSNRLLYKQIINNNGLVISEFPPNMQAQPGLFVQRNRLISGLSKGILVAEGLKDSGSLITARFAASQGKDVFAPPAPINSEFSEAPNMLLKEGAKLVTKTNDILEEYSLSVTVQHPDHILESLSLEEQAVYKLLAQQPHDSDELARKLHVLIYKILTILSTLEMKGLIIKKGGMYSVK